MPSDQVVVYCKNCKKSTVQVKQRANHILHLLLSVVTVGIWLIVWFFIALFTSDTPTCTICGNEVKNNNSMNQNNMIKGFDKSLIYILLILISFSAVLHILFPIILISASLFNILIPYSITLYVFLRIFIK